MPGITGPTHVDSLPGVPTPADTATAFPGNFNFFAVSLAAMVTQANSRLLFWVPTLGFGISMTELPPPPQTPTSNFAIAADAFLAALPTLRSDVNGVISALSLPCAAVSALPTVPSRGGDPVNFGSEAVTFLAALPTFRTELNAFITALDNYDPSSTRFDATAVHWDSTTHTWDAG